MSFRTYTLTRGGALTAHDSSGQGEGRGRGPRSLMPSFILFWQRSCVTLTVGCSSKPTMAWNRFRLHGRMILPSLGPPPVLRICRQHCGTSWVKSMWFFNFEHGKTGAVVAFRGHAAPQLRQVFQLCPCPGLDIALSDGREAHLHFETNYKHLGTIFTTQHDLQVELTHRIGIAQATFSLLSRPLLCNKRLPSDLRLRLFNALVGARLFFCLGSWHTLPLRLFDNLSGFARLTLVFFAESCVFPFLHRLQMARCFKERIRLMYECAWQLTDFALRKSFLHMRRKLFSMSSSKRRRTIPALGSLGCVLMLIGFMPLSRMRSHNLGLGILRT